MSVSFKLSNEVATYYTVEGWSSSADIEAQMGVKPQKIETWRKLYFKKTKTDPVSGRRYFSYFACSLSVSPPLSAPEPLGVWDVVLTHFVKDSQDRRVERAIDWTVDFDVFASKNIRLYLIHDAMPIWSAFSDMELAQAANLAVKNGAATEIYTNRFFDVNLFLKFVKDARNGVETPIGTVKSYSNAIGASLNALRLT